MKNEFQGYSNSVLADITVKFVILEQLVQVFDISE